MAWLVPFSELTPEQQEAVQLDTDSNKAIVGGPGSGKTMVLLHRLQHLARLAKSQPGAVHCFVYTTTLKDYIRSSLDVLRLPQECVTTFDHWCIEQHKRYIGALPQVQDGNFMRPDFDAIRKAVHRLWTGNAAALPRFRYVLVDEAQDLDKEALEIIRLAADHVTVAMDGKQQLYDDRLAEEGVLQILRLKRANRALLPAYRCNPMVTRLAANYIDDEARRAEFLRQGKNAQGDRAKPLLYLAADYDDEKRRLADLVRTRIANGDRVAILFPQRRMVYGYRTGLEALGITTETDSRKGVDFTSRTPKILTYHEAKGLTFDAVFMPRLDTSAFRNLLALRAFEMLFVGISRATSFACLCAVEGKVIDEVAGLVGKGDVAGYLEVQRAAAREDVIPPSSTKSDDWLGETDLL